MLGRRVLMCLAVLCLASLVMGGEGGPSLRTYILRPSAEISTKQVLAELGKCILLKRTSVKGNSLDKVVNLLQDAEDKKSKIFLDEISVDNLLALNSAKLSDCTRTELAIRDDVCAELEEAHKANAAFYFWDCEKSLTGRVYKHLFDYCEQMTTTTRNWCSGAREEVAGKVLKNFPSKRINSFRKEVHNHQNYKAGLSTKDSWKPITDVLQEKNAAEKEEVLSSCAKLVDYMSTIHQFGADRPRLISNLKPGTWEEAFEFCRVALNPNQFAPQTFVDTI